MESSLIWENLGHLWLHSVTLAVITTAMSYRFESIAYTLNGSKIVEFALNPVSINQRGQFAIRVKLADGRQLILRGDHA